MMLDNMLVGAHVSEACHLGLLPRLINWRSCATRALALSIAARVACLQRGPLEPITKTHYACAKAGPTGNLLHRPTAAKRPVRIEGHQPAIPANPFAPVRRFRPESAARHPANT